MKKEEKTILINHKSLGERDYILNKLREYRGINDDEEKMRKETIIFVQNNFNCFSRKLLVGHVNGSAWIVDPEMEKALLTHHAKLDKWLQLGGHSDEDPNTLNVSYKEAVEESGLQNIEVFSQEIFDIDIHTIPEKGDEPEHLHYDIRFIFKANPDEELQITSESKDLQWVELDTINGFNPEESMIRMITKTKSLRK